MRHQFVHLQFFLFLFHIYLSSLPPTVKESIFYESLSEVEGIKRSLSTDE